jgi:uncharacterized protein YukE
MSPGPGRPTLKISQVEQWKPDVLGTDATSFGTVVTKGDQLLHSMQTEQDDLSHSWKGDAADAAAARMTSEKTAGSHIMTKVDSIKTVFTAQQKELADAKNFVIGKRNLIQGMGFEVADDGTVTSVAKQAAIKAAGGRNPSNDHNPGRITAALIEVEYEAAQHQVEMVSALQFADNTATAAKTLMDEAKSDLSRLALLEVPPQAIRALYPGLLHPDTAKPSELPPNWQVMGGAMKLENGIPLTVTNPDGSTKTVTPNPDGTLTVSSSYPQPDGSTVTTESTGNHPPITTVTKPAANGILDMTVTTADGKSQHLQQVPNGGGRTTTYAINPDGSRGTKISDTYPQNGGTTTDKYGPNGVIDRQWQRPDGYRAFEQYVPGKDGQPQLVGVSNSAGVQATMNPDGTVTTHYPDGQTAHTQQGVDGRIVTKFEDGSVLQYDPSQAPAGTPKESVWDNVKSWTGTEWKSLSHDTVGTVHQHPIATGIAAGTAAGGEWTYRSGESMAKQAGTLMAQSHIDQMNALQMLDSGTPGAGHAFSGALDSATDASTKAEVGSLLKAEGGTLKGVPLGAAVNAYVNLDDWRHHNKPLDQAVANAAGGTLGGWAGAAAGAELGAGACAVGGPIGSAFCAGMGAAIGGFLLGSGGAWAAEQPFH